MKLFFRRFLQIALLFILTGCGLSQCGHNWNHKLTLKIQTPSGIRSASSVYETVAFPTLGFRRLFTYGFLFYGEALPINLALAGSNDPKWLFVTTKSRVYQSSLASSVYAEELKTLEDNSWNLFSLEDFEWVPLMTKLKEMPPKIVKADLVPKMIVFDDITDFKTARLVGTADFAEFFGRGYSFVSLTLELTGETPTPKIENILGKLDKYYSTMLDGKRARSNSSKFPVANSLNISALIMRPRK